MVKSNSCVGYELNVFLLLLLLFFFYFIKIIKLVFYYSIRDGDHVAKQIFLYRVTDNTVNADIISRKLMTNQIRV